MRTLLILWMTALASIAHSSASSEKVHRRRPFFSESKNTLKPRHDGLRHFIANQAPVGQPSVAEIEAGISEAQAQGRLIHLSDRGLSLPYVMKEIAQLPVTFRSTINDVAYEITVLSIHYTGPSAYLSIGCRFTPPKSGVQLYFGSNTIQVSGKSGFAGALPILESSLTDAKSGELDDAKGLLSGETRFAEFSLPGFRDNLAIGLGKTSQLEFSCGTFGRFNLSGVVKAYSIVEKETATGENRSDGKPLLLVFKDQITSDWKDLMLDAEVASPFHAKNYPDLGFHFDKKQFAQIDLSSLRNPASLPSCAQVVGESWHGIAFPAFSVRLPRFFNIRSGKALTLGEGKNLFMDANGLLGTVSAEKVFTLKEGYTDEIHKYDMSLDQLTATYSCNGQVAASMLGNIAIPWCGTATSSTAPLLRYSFRYDNNKYEIFIKDTEKGNFNSNKYTLSTGSKLTFSIDNNQFNTVAEPTEKPTISTDAFNNSICRDYAATLKATQCTNKQLIWSTGEEGALITVKPTRTSTYTVQCRDNYCVSSVSDSLKITVHESLPQPSLISGRDAFCRYESTDVRAENCIGKIEWQLPGSSAFAQQGSDERVRNVSFPTIEQATTYTYSVRCNLNGCLSPTIARTLTVQEEPARPSLYSSAANNTIDRNGSVTIGGNCKNGARLIWENLPQATVSLATTSTYYAVCRNDATGCQSADKASITVNVLYFPPAAPSNLMVSGSGTDFVNLTWQDNANNEDEFWVIRSANPSFSSHTTVGTVGPNTTSFRNNGLTEGVTWYYQVIAHNRYDNGYSNITSGNTLVRPGAPQLRAESTMIVRGNSANVTATCAVGNVVWLTPGGFAGGYRQQQDHVTYSARCINAGIEGDAASITVQVCDQPGATVSVEDLTITSGKAGKLTAQGCEGGSISWNTGSRERTIEVSQAGYYTATCTKTNDCGTSTATDGGTVRLEDKPCPLPTPSVTVNDLAIKSGTTGKLTAYGCEGGSVTWNTGVNGPEIAVNQAGYYTATCVVTNSCGTGSASDGGTVSVTACDPPATPWISVDDLPLEQNTSGTLQAQGCDGGTIRWNTGSTERSITVNQAGYYSATCTVTNSCGSSSASDGGQVTVKEPECDLSIPIIAGPTEVQKGEAFSLTAIDRSFRGEIIRSNWGYSVIPAISGSTRGDMLNCSIQETTTFTYFVESKKCSKTSEPFVVKVKPSVPKPVLSYEDSYICPGEVLNVTISNCPSNRFSWKNLTTDERGIKEGNNFLISKVGEYVFQCTQNEATGESTYIFVRQLSAPAAPVLSGKDVVKKGELFELTASGCQYGQLKWSLPSNFRVTSEGSGSSTVSGFINENTQFAVACHFKCTSSSSTKSVTATASTSTGGSGNGNGGDSSTPPSTAPQWRFYRAEACADGKGNLWKDYNPNSPTYGMITCCMAYRATRNENATQTPTLSYIDCEGNFVYTLLYPYYANSVSPIIIFAREGSAKCTDCTLTLSNN